MISRRGLITGLAGLVAAPAIVRVSSLMPVKAYTVSLSDWECMGPIEIVVPVSPWLRGGWSQYELPPLFGSFLPLERMR